MKRKVDQNILDELINTPEVQKAAENMTPEERVLFRQLLVTTGIYDRYVKERNGRRV